MEPAYHTEFLTATILNWQPLMRDDRFKQIVADALQWLAEEKRCTIFGFVIMPNHLHLLWRIAEGFARREVQGALLSFTAHEFKACLKGGHCNQLKNYRSDAADRKYQFWERDSLVKECWSQPYFIQKLEYIHNNPCQPHWQLAPAPEAYRWSSASFYHNGSTEFTWLTHYRG